MVRYLDGSNAINASSQNKMQHAQAALAAESRADRADFPASQNSHCCYSAAFSIMERDAAALDQGLLEQIDVSKVELRATAARQHLAEPEDALLDAEYAAAQAGSSWPERMYWLKSNWRWLLAEAAIYAGALAVLSMPVWAGAAGKALLETIAAIDWAQLGAALTTIGEDYVQLLDSIIAR